MDVEKTIFFHLGTGFVLRGCCGWQRHPGLAWHAMVPQRSLHHASIEWIHGGQIMYAPELMELLSRRIMMNSCKSVIFAALMSMCFVPSLAVAQEGAPEPQGEEMVRMGGVDASSTDALDDPGNEWPSLSVKRSTMMSRGGEIAWQLESGLILGYGVGFFSQGLLPGSFYDVEANSSVIYAGGMSAMIALGGGAAVYTAGRLNGSRADWKMVLLGGLAGAGVNTLLTGLAGKAPWSEDASLTQSLLAPAVYAVLPVVGSVVGYQLSSSWRTGETEHERRSATATSIYVLPTSQGVSAGLGFGF